ncbi:MAG TPA: amidohydrolase family protein [Chitinophagaceae bacterium]|nr:amidohydrolase family protein [Chitinophagaceae bacterium]
MHFYSADFVFDGYRFLPSGSVLCFDNDGYFQSVLSEADPVTIEFKKGLLMPGMVNVHGHLELSVFKNQIARHTGMVNFLMDINRLRASFTEEDTLEAIASAEAYMVSRGIVAMGDICNTLLTLEQKKKSNLYYHSFVEVFGLNPAQAESRMENARILCEQYSEWHASSVVLHAPYSVSESLMRQVSNEAPIQSIHNQESQAESELFFNAGGPFYQLFEQVGYSGPFYWKKGLSSVQQYLPYLNKQAQHILVHNTFTTLNDIEFVQKELENVYWCFCPAANVYIENRLPDISLFLSKSSRLVLGTDSLASNTELDLFHEIAIIQQHIPAIGLEELLKWATIHGAKALRMDNHLGSFEKGKKPGLIQLSNVTDHTRLPEHAEVAVLLKA